VCAARDKKGIYAKAKAGLIKDFTGISAPYEVPKDPDLTIRSSEEDASQSAKRVIKLLEEYDLI
jgi:adenylylsulfate kinase-like enzyme